MPEQSSATKIAEWFKSKGKKIGFVSPINIGGIFNVTFNFNSNSGNGSNNSAENADMRIEAASHRKIDEISSSERQELEDFRQILIPSFQEEGDYFLRSEDYDALDRKANIKQLTQQTDPEVIKFINTEVPGEDRAIWVAALSIRQKFIEKDAQAVHLLKSQVIRVAGRKGNNITNLCTSGYLENLIIPAYKGFVGSSERSGGRESFRSFYQNLVLDLPSMIFVSGVKKYDELISEAISKVQNIGNYGLSKVAIHGIGEDNAKKIIDLKRDLEQRRPELGISKIDLKYEGNLATLVIFLSC